MLGLKLIHFSKGTSGKQTCQGFPCTVYLISFYAEQFSFEKGHTLRPTLTQICTNICPTESTIWFSLQYLWGFLEYFLIVCHRFQPWMPPPPKKKKKKKKTPKGCYGKTKFMNPLIFFFGSGYNVECTTVISNSYYLTLDAHLDTIDFAPNTYILLIYRGKMYIGSASL